MTHWHAITRMSREILLRMPAAANASPLGLCSDHPPKTQMQRLGRYCLNECADHVPTGAQHLPRRQLDVARRRRRYAGLHIFRTQRRSRLLHAVSLQFCKAWIAGGKRLGKHRHDEGCSPFRVHLLDVICRRCVTSKPALGRRLRDPEAARNQLGAVTWISLPQEGGDARAEAERLRCHGGASRRCLWLSVSHARNAWQGWVDSTVETRWRSRQHVLEKRHVCEPHGLPGEFRAQAPPGFPVLANDQFTARAGSRKRGVFRYVADLNQAIPEYLAAHNANQKPFCWTASADTIISKHQRGKHLLGPLH